ncbi:hypothetical protein CR51_05700 [Caballeronia megalochromosomata]|nr:hypothetical protein CR51_05700 [Caballeronia megalochromosomata]
MPEQYIDRLRKATFSVKSSSFIKRRRLVLLRVLEATGARRIEIASLTVESVLAAKKMERPFLQMLTFKRGGEPVPRLVPINHTDLAYLVEYIVYFRSTIVERKLGDTDHGLVFINERSAKPLKPGTVTLELHILRKAAEIKGRAHPHLFRHRYVTMALYRLIRAYKIKDKDHFSDALFKLRDFAQRVMEWTGHKDIESLSRYVDWAFALSATVEGKAEEVDISELARTGRITLQELKEMRHDMSAADFASEVLKRFHVFVKDMSRIDGEKGVASVESALGRLGGAAT